MTLDHLGKWSLIDLYVLILTMLAFRIHLVNPTTDFVIDKLWSIDLKVTPTWGLFSFCIAAITSLILSHVALFAHRNATTNAVVAAQKHESFRQHELQEIATDSLGGDLSESVSESILGTGLISDVESPYTMPAGSPSWLGAGTSDVSGLRGTLVRCGTWTRVTLDHF